ncbi:MAG TPA: AmmeMemoRadiSam system protein B [Verrucomicrobiae bacterium]|nr:AmmeMemoRadiSam system protein B [Verrucomicrobiae bacterium]
MPHPTPGTATDRKPYVAGHFYPIDPARLRQEVDAHLASGKAPPRPARGIVVPHAGYMYSGAIAGAVYAAAELPRRLVLIGPNHTGLGRPISIMNRGAWLTPLGAARIDEALADLILDSANIVEADPAAHHAEHSLEVQIPFLQARVGDFTFAPICVGTGRRADLLTLAAAIAGAASTLDEPIGLVISTDMTHYEPAEAARVKDWKAIRRMETLDGDGLHRVVREEEISMCGYAAAAAGLLALRRLGASRAEVVAYGNSGDTSGNFDEVVGYAGLLIP